MTLFIILVDGLFALVFDDFSFETIFEMNRKINDDKGNINLNVFIDYTHAICFEWNFWHNSLVFWQMMK